VEDSDMRADRGVGFGVVLGRSGLITCERLRDGEWEKNHEVSPAHRISPIHVIGIERTKRRIGENTKELIGVRRVTNHNI
jgi:hypothetical protein